MIELDDFDRKILRVLATDGRVSNLDLAARIGLSASACLRRVQALEKSGAIRGYRAVLDPAILGGGFLAYVLVGLSRHTRAEQRAFEAAIANEFAHGLDALASAELAAGLEAFARRPR
ncbi:MAG: Lrp/AsnC family transcriptional regulator [Alphaproteobacteria bacterium]|nr:Lrp/AsnC family transcriptional regulator [Alphaproteobacteria bacterium]